MYWFLRDEKIYIGPVNDIQLDTITVQLLNSGIACRANNGSVATYVTIPANSISANDLAVFKPIVGN